MTEERYEYIKSVKDKYVGQLFSIPGVNGVGVGMDCICITFNDTIPGSDITQVPEELDGVKTEVLVVGEWELYGGQVEV